MSSPHPQLTRVQLGVWTVAILNDTKPALYKAFDSFVSSFSVYRRVAYDIYNAERLISVLYLLCIGWEIVAPALVLHTSNDLLACIERSIRQGKPEVARICWNLGAHVFMSGISALQFWTCGNIAQPRLQTAFKLHFEFQLMQTHLNLDVPTSLNPLTKKKLHLESLAESLVVTAVEMIIAFLQLITQVGLLMYLTSNSPVLLVLSLAEPIHSVITRRTLYNTPHISHTENSEYKRSKSLVAMSAPTFRSEVLSSNLVSYIIDEYKRSSAILLNKGLSSDHPRVIFTRRSTPLNNIASAVLRDSKIVYFAIVAMMSPGKFSPVIMFSLMNTCEKIGRTMSSAIREMANSQAATSDLRALYDIQNVAHVITDGTVAYPRAGLDSSDEGMAFDLRNVSFTYPGGKTVKPALANISVSISAGQLVVIVGANGSGKSTIIKLLTRLYDTTSEPESLLLDGLPLSNYCISDLRRATAVLTQDNSLFSLSLGENIGIGYPDKAGDNEMITQAAELGGATHCVEKFESGKDTVLDEKLLAAPRMANVLSSDTEHPLAMRLAELKKNTEISGGEKQRILASRTFMRLRSKAIRFVVVDEPTSALDSEGEMNLFNNLINARKGKTMIFVTHRFGHLVKRADLILCMKDGAIVQSGSHETLISQDGEYAKLYNIQAKAFVDDTGA